MAKKRPTIKELEAKMSKEQLRKLKVHYGMGVSGDIGRAANWKPKKRKRK